MTTSLQGGCASDAVVVNFADVRLRLMRARCNPAEIRESANKRASDPNISPSERPLAQSQLILYMINFLPLFFVSDMSDIPTLCAA